MPYRWGALCSAPLRRLVMQNKKLPGKAGENIYGTDEVGRGEKSSAECKMMSAK